MKPITHYSMCLYKALQQETGQVGIIGISVFTLRMQPFSFSVICLIIFCKPSYHLIFCSLWYVLRPRPTTLEEFDNIGFTLKTHQMFFVHTTPVSGITWLSWRHHFRKARFENVFRPHEKKKRRCFQISPVWKAFFEKFRPRDGLVWTEGCLTVERNKAEFSNSTGVAWTLPKWSRSPFLNFPFRIYRINNAILFVKRDFTNLRTDFLNVFRIQFVASDISF